MIANNITNKINKTVENFCIIEQMDKLHKTIEEQKRIMIEYKKALSAEIAADINLHFFNIYKTKMPKAKL
jgi:di/tripeptidase